MLKNIIKKIINVFGQVNDNPRRNVRCVKCRKLGFEVLEGRELLSAVGLDDNFYDNTFDYNETFYSNDYYESGSVSGYSESNTYDEFDQNQENTMSSGKGECNIFSLSGPTATNGLVPTFSEATQDTFNVTINNESLLMDNICSDGDFQLIFGGTASKDDFAIYDGNNLISNDTTSWSNNTVFFYSIPVGATSVTLTFKIIDNQFLEPSTENLTISVGCVSSGGEMGGCVCMIDTISVTIINDSFSVEWQTIDGTDSNKATLSPDTVNQGQRVFPEKSTPNGAIENKFELVFKLETAATASVTLYYKFFDPDNFIGLGNNDNNASSWAGGDNYATSSITTGSITIAAGATNKALTVVVYPAGYTGTKLTASATTIIIDTVHAGDNFIVVVDTDQAKTNAAALGTTETTRYKEIHSYAQTELLTVWRTLNVELDVAAWTGMPAGNLKMPLNGLVATELARACIVAKEFTANNTAVPNVGNDGVDKNEDDTLLGITGNNSGRDIPANSTDFWTVRIVTIPYYNYGGYNDYYGAFTPGTNTIAICYELISDDVTSWNASNDPDIDFQVSLRQNVLHEIGHVLMDGDHTGTGVDASIMTSGVGATDKVSGPYLKFLNLQIQEIQNLSRSKD